MCTKVAESLHVSYNAQISLMFGWHRCTRDSSKEWCTFIMKHLSGESEKAGVFYPAKTVYGCLEPGRCLIIATKSCAE